jgi:hypothetical protein
MTLYVVSWDNGNGPAVVSSYGRPGEPQALAFTTLDAAFRSLRRLRQEEQIDGLIVRKFVDAARRGGGAR